MTIQQALNKCHGDYSLDNIRMVFFEEYHILPQNIIDKFIKNFLKYLYEEYSIYDAKKDLPATILYLNKEYYLNIVELDIKGKKSIIGGYKSDKGYLFYHIEEPVSVIKLYNKLKQELTNYNI